MTTEHRNGEETAKTSDDKRSAERLQRAIIWVASVSVISGIAAFVVARAVVMKREADPTGERIQDLLDEANRLLKTLDAPKPV